MDKMALDPDWYGGEECEACGEEAHGDYDGTCSEPGHYQMTL